MVDRAVLARGVSRGESRLASGTVPPSIFRISNSTAGAPTSAAGMSTESSGGVDRSATSSGQIATTEMSSGHAAAGVAQRREHAGDGRLVVHHQAGQRGPVA